MKYNEIHEILEWGTDIAPAQYHLDEFHGYLQKRFVEDFYEKDSPNSSELRALYADLNSESISKIINSPGSSFYLLRPGKFTLAEAYKYFIDAGLAELKRNGKITAHIEDIWTAMGDVYWGPGEEVFISPRYWRNLFVDFKSPYACSIQLSSGEKPLIEANGEFSDQDQSSLMEILTKAMRTIYQTNEHCEEFINIFTKSLVIRKRQPGKKGILTRSPERFIGLKVFELNEIEENTWIDFMEGLVHESIHTLLDSIELLSKNHVNGKEPWINSNELYNGELIIKSPWTGNSLTLPAFIHACFVWYSLVFFWSNLLAAGEGNNEYLMTRYRIAIAGFLQHPLAYYLGNEEYFIHSDIRDALQHMQENIKSNLLVCK